MEPFPTVLTGIGSGVRVDEEVRRERGGAFEGFATHLAFKTFFLGIKKVTSQSEKISSKQFSTPLIIFISNKGRYFAIRKQWELCEDLYCFLCSFNKVFCPLRIFFGSH